MSGPQHIAMLFAPKTFEYIQQAKLIIVNPQCYDRKSKKRLRKRLRTVFSALKTSMPEVADDAAYLNQTITCLKRLLAQESVQPFAMTEPQEDMPAEIQQIHRELCELTDAYTRAHQAEHGARAGNFLAAFHLTLCTDMHRPDMHDKHQPIIVDAERRRTAAAAIMREHDCDSLTALAKKVKDTASTCLEHYTGRRVQFRQLCKTAREILRLYDELGACKDISEPTVAACSA